MDRLTKKQALKLLVDADAKIRKFMFASFGKDSTVLGFQCNKNYLRDLETMQKILQKYFQAVDRK